MNNRGITLVAMIITIIALIIIAGVSISFSIGNNGIINKTEEARYKDSITQIEEKLNSFYTENYMEIEDYNLGDIKEDTPITKARALAYYFNNELNNDNIFRPISVNNTYHDFDDDKFAYVSSDGLIFYMLSPEKLKKYDSSLSIIGLDEPDDRINKDDIDNIYCVTSDLRVFIIKEDINHLIGITKEEISLYDSH